MPEQLTITATALTREGAIRKVEQVLQMMKRYLAGVSEHTYAKGSAVATFTKQGKGKV